jgi:16S rRNA (guanine527-N7)-methyltransferase
VAELPVLLEYALPLLKTGGRFFAAKGLEPEKEIGTAQRALILLKGEIENVEKYFLASGAEHRSMVIVKKIGATPHKYPRAAGKPKRNPL